MFDELRYRWQLRKYLKDYFHTVGVHESVTDFRQVEGEPDIRRAMDKEKLIQINEIAAFRSRYLEKQAFKYHVPLPSDEDSWLKPRFESKPYLTEEAAQKLRADIRAEQKANWEYWANRVTLALALVGSIFGVLAYFKK